MDYLGALETVAVSLCGIATILWMSIGTLSRTTGREILTQRIIASLCCISAGILFLIHYSGGELWGSRNVARPSAVTAVIVAIAAMMNIKGKEVQRGANPHKIMKSKKDE
ncbi:MAG TPA: hypothetical protein QF703_02650 [Candidatus Thalassarchaeaceae archaeon]|nr:hypothetical protein [Candidatus Thalassarchaeaceae archaeon]|tara:strand:- start:1097 stop:1426 length:330 start_codon:yes stop_codon:yes gene_type:complete